MLMNHRRKWLLLILAIIGATCEDAVAPGPPSTLTVVSGQPLIVRAGTTPASIMVQVMDSRGIGVPASAVEFDLYEVTLGPTGLVRNNGTGLGTVVSDQRGLASLTPSLPVRAGEYELEATTNGGLRASMRVVVTPDSAVTFAVTPDTATIVTGVAGSGAFLRAQGYDRFKNAIELPVQYENLNPQTVMVSIAHISRSAGTLNTAWVFPVQPGDATVVVRSSTWADTAHITVR